jgi:hypothetical protein
VRKNSYDLSELARYYRAYRQLMDHWREVLPEGLMLEVNYGRSSEIWRARSAVFCRIVVSLG